MVRNFRRGQSKHQPIWNIESCEFVEGLFDDTMPRFSVPIVTAFLDVDLASSTRTCLKYLYPLLVPGGVLIAHDGHLPLVRDVYSDAEFWTKEVGCRKPHVEGLGTQKLLKIVKR
jgi:O-methyltransferase